MKELNNELDEYVVTSAMSDRKWKQQTIEETSKRLSEVIDWAVIVNQEIADCFGVSSRDLLIDGHIATVRADCIQLLNCLQRWETAVKKEYDNEKKV